VLSLGLRQLVVCASHQQRPQGLLDEQLVALAVGCCCAGVGAALWARTSQRITSHSKKVMQRHAASDLLHGPVEIREEPIEPVV